ncbi:hypothetical protein, partial [Latilactobacillus fuchuensis]|uniref:hypothetical protein n=1 Tax=Latilactobacillus fuchuensis TaxID=164393 RepID=UPI0020C7C15F
MEGLLLKFIEKEYIESFKKGEIFFKNIQYFKKVEHNELLGIKDPKEGTHQKKLNVSNELIRINIDGEDLKLPVESATLSFEYPEIKHVAIASFVFLPVTEFIVNPLKENTYTIKSTFINDLVEEFKDRPFVILDAKNLISQIKNCNLRKNDVNYYKIDMVKYYQNENSDKNPNEMTMKDVYDLCS